MEPRTPISKIPENLCDADLALRQLGHRPENVAWAMLQSPHFSELDEIKKNTRFEGDQIERVLVWHAAQKALGEIGDVPMDDWFRDQLRKDLLELHAIKAPLGVGGYAFERAAMIATLRRFPGGPMEWMVSGIPRSWLLRTPFPANVRLLKAVLALGGFAPCLFMHVAPAPRNRGLSVPRQVLRAYFHAARSLALHTGLRAIVAHAWFHDPAAIRDHPHLEVLNRPYLEWGGLLIPLWPAPSDSGVLEGNAQRKSEYLAGNVAYRYGLAIWPRGAALRWAEAHPELG